MRKSVKRVLWVAGILVVVGLLIALAASLMPHVYVFGRELEYEDFWVLVRQDRVGAVIYDCKAGVIYGSYVESELPLDDLLLGCDFFVETELGPFWNDMADLEQVRLVQGLSPRYGFSFEIMGVGRSASFSEYIPYLLLLLLLGLAIIILMRGLLHYRKQKINANSERLKESKNKIDKK